MKWFGDLKISSKLGVASGLILVALAGVGTFASYRLYMVGEAGKHITADEMPGMVALMDMNTNTSDLRLATIREVGAEIADVAAARHKDSEWAES